MRHLQVNSIVQLKGNAPERLTGVRPDGTETEIVVAELPEWATLRVVAIGADGPTVALDYGEQRIFGCRLSWLKLKFE